LLGTWSGATGEMWNKDTSTFLQVLVSIQSLILVPMPYFNEPGYERSMGTPQGDSSNRRYNENIRVATIRFAMLGQLKSPPPGFEAVIRSHFYLKKDFLSKQCDEWLLEAANCPEGKSHYSTLLQVVKDFKNELAALKAP